MSPLASHPSERIAAAVASWPGVEASAHRFGGIEYRVGRRELGHVHGDAIADLPLPRRVADELIVNGRAGRHRWVPDSGWVTVDLAAPGGVETAIELFRLGYDRAQAAAERRGKR